MDGGALEEDAHEFVRIPSDGIGSRDAVELVTEFLRHEQTTAPSGVNVQPEVMLLANVGKRMDGIERAEHGRARSGSDEKRDLAVGDALEHQTLQFLRYHLTPFYLI